VNSTLKTDTKLVRDGNRLGRWAVLGVGKRVPEEGGLRGWGGFREGAEVWMGKLPDSTRTVMFWCPMGLLPRAGWGVRACEEAGGWGWGKGPSSGDLGLP